MRWVIGLISLGLASLVIFGYLNDWLLLTIITSSVSVAVILLAIWNANDRKSEERYSRLFRRSYDNRDDDWK